MNLDVPTWGVFQIEINKFLHLLLDKNIFCNGDLFLYLWLISSEQHFMRQKKLFLFLSGERTKGLAFFKKILLEFPF